MTVVQKFWLWTGRLTQVITVFKAISFSLPIVLPLILNHWNLVAICSGLFFSFLIGRFSMAKHINHGLISTTEDAD